MRVYRKIAFSHTDFVNHPSVFGAIKVWRSEDERLGSERNKEH